jgi:hypothetical protein
MMWEFRSRSWGRAIDISPRLALRDGDWKLLMNPDGSAAELYDMRTGYDETANLAAIEPEVAARLKARLLAWYRDELPERDRVDPATTRPKWRWPAAVKFPP